MSKAFSHTNETLLSLQRGLTGRSGKNNSSQLPLPPRWVLRADSPQPVLHPGSAKGRGMQGGVSEHAQGWPPSPAKKRGLVRAQCSLLIQTGVAVGWPDQQPKKPHLAAQVTGQERCWSSTASTRRTGLPSKGQDKRGRMQFEICICCLMCNSPKTTCRINSDSHRAGPA